MRTRPARIQALQTQAAFTLQDSIALVAGLALLAATQLPSFASARSAGHRAVCQDNLRQLTRAWTFFAEDNDGSLAGNLDGATAWSSTNQTWAVGWLTLETQTPDNTNWAALMQSQLGAHARSPAIYKCPADTSLGPVPGGPPQPRVRSVSMNSYVGQRSSSYTPGYRQFRLLSEIVAPSPAELFVFIDEREDSINDACFLVDMNGYQPPTPGSYILVDYPGDRHNRAGSLSFADGHAETWRWKDPRTTPIHRSSSSLPLVMPSPNNADLERLQQATSRKLTP